MDGDRQDDPAEIPKLLAKLDEGYDLVSGWKQSRQDPISKTVPSKMLQLDGAQVDGRLAARLQLRPQGLPQRGTEHVKVYGELHRYIPVLASDLGFRVAEVKVSHRRRTSGTSKYGWRRYARGYLDLLTVLFLGRYRQRPQHLFGGIGTFMVVVGVLVDLYLTIDKFFGHPIGQRPLLLLGTLLIIVGIQLLSLGLVGELITQARARDKRDDYEVERVIDGAAARAELDGSGAARGAAPPAARSGRAVAAPQPARPSS